MKLFGSAGQETLTRTCPTRKTERSRPSTRRVFPSECVASRGRGRSAVLRIRGTTFSVRTAEERGEVCAALIPEVLPAVEAGSIKPIIDRVVPFADAQLAAERMRSNEAAGKLVLTLD